MNHYYISYTYKKNDWEQIFDDIIAPVDDKPTAHYNDYINIIKWYISNQKKLGLTKIIIINMYLIPNGFLKIGE